MDVRCTICQAVPASGALGAGAMSLYHYVANREELLDAMVDLVFDEIELSTEETDWQSAMRRRGLSARQALARHTWAIGLLESRTSPGPANLRHPKIAPKFARCTEAKAAASTNAARFVQEVRETSVHEASTEELPPSGLSVTAIKATTRAALGVDHLRLGGSIADVKMCVVRRDAR